MTAAVTQLQTNKETKGTRGPWRSSDLDLLPENGSRYEIIDGELLMSKSPHWHHQAVCGNVYMALKLWCRQHGHGAVAVTPGLIFADADDVIPDVVWISDERLDALMDDAGHLNGAPELAVEVLSFGPRNEERDRTAKRKLYETQGVQEYWILDWRIKQVEVYCRENGELRRTATLLKDDSLTSPLLPEFCCAVAELFD